MRSKNRGELMTKVALGADHGGYHLKKESHDFLVAEGYKTVDYGTNSPEPCDYPL